MNHISIRFLVSLARKGDNPVLQPVSRYNGRADQLAHYFARVYPSGTFTRAEGYWQGKAEPSAVFEVIVPDEPGYRDGAAQIASRLAALHRQESVAVSIAPVAFELHGPADLDATARGRYAREEFLSPATQELARNAGASVYDGAPAYARGIFSGDFKRARDEQAEEAAGRG